MQEFRVNQTALFQKVIIAETEEDAIKEFEKQLDAECEVETFESNWSELRCTSLEQERKDRIESVKELEDRENG